MHLCLQFLSNNLKLLIVLGISCYLTRILRLKLGLHFLTLVIKPGPVPRFLGGQIYFSSAYIYGTSQKR